MKGAVLTTVIDALTEDAHTPELKRRISDGVRYIATTDALTVSQPFFNRFLIASFTRTCYQSRYLDIPAKELADDLIGLFEASMREVHDPLVGQKILSTMPYEIPEWFMRNDPEAAFIEAFTQYFLDNYDRIHQRFTIA